MKKLISIILSVVLATGILTGCAAKDVEFLDEIKKADKYVTLGQYKGIELTGSKTEITDEYMDRYMEFMCTQLATYEEVTGRPVQDGDMVNIDFVGYMDGEQFEGGSSQGYNLTIGSNSFIDGFESGLIGAEIGEKRTLDLNFPDPYNNNPDLSGAPVQFEVTINSISEESIPELTDELVQGFGLTGVVTVDGLRKLLKEQFEADAQSAYRESLAEQIALYVTQNSEYTMIPNKMVERHQEQMVRKLKSDASSAGMDLADYLLYYYGVTDDGMEETLRSQAEESVKQMLAFKAIAEKEKITVNAYEISDALETDSQAAGMTVEEYRSGLDERSYEEYVLSNKVLDFIIEQANVTAPSDEAE